MSRFGVPRSARSLDELLADAEVEGVVVTTPNDAHASIILECVDAGVPVFTDKPIADTVQSAAAIERAVESAGHLFAVGHSARRLGGHRMMRRLLDEGRLGGVSMAECNFTTPTGLGLTADSWRFYSDKSPGGALIQLGVHHSDTLQYLLGPAKSVSAHLRRTHTSAEIPDATMAIIEFESGALAYLGAGWASPRVYEFRVHGTDSNVAYGLDLSNWASSHLLDDSGHFTITDHEGSRPVELPQTDMFREELEEFADAIRGEAQIEVGAKEAIRALAVVEAAIESSGLRGRAVDVDRLIAERR
jgi:predicted dehydrogenase